MVPVMGSSDLRRLPSVDEVLRSAPLRPLLDEYPRPVVVRAVRETIDELRARLRAGEPLPESGPVVAVESIRRRARRALRPSLGRVVNATGVVIHTNLGRSPLPAEALETLESTAARYSNLEYDLEEGRRGSRYDHITGLLAEVIGAEEAHVVNNNAAALLLCATALASGREIVVSRGELIEIGDGFRIPDVIRQGGAVLREVGTTNRTRIGDYERALGDDTAVLAKIHRSNFYQEGFTEDVEIADLAELARRAGLVTLYDAGSGVIELPPGLRGHGEPALGAVLAQGADLVTASGDKVLGGPQAGIIAGRAEVVRRLRHHPMTRALRPCKLTLGVLHHVLALYRDGRAAEIPTFSMLSQPLDELRRRARRLARRIRALPGASAAAVGVRRQVARVGGGALPRQELTTWVVALRLEDGGAARLERALRGAEVPVIARIVSDELVLDMRTVRDDELKLVAAALGPVLAPLA
jgi:L-seryl-tRNA(Ser) seleniumtransferase